jgi:ribokinase
MDCLIVGDTNADLCAKLECFPLEGDDTAITGLGFHSGGTAANVAVAYARLGGSARLLSRVGNDFATKIALHAAMETGVDLTFLQHDATLATGLCLAAISPNGERTFFSYRGANVALELPNIDHVFQDVLFLHISGHALLDGNQRTTTLMLLDEARRRNIATSIDLCLPLLRKRPREIMTLVPRLSTIFANARELELLGSSLGFAGTDFDRFNAAVSALTHDESPLVVAKLGAAGSQIAKGLSRIHVPPLPVHAVDTTGAGDGFVAAFLFVLLRGGSPEMAAHVGNVVGALVSSRSGAADASPTRDEVLATLTAQGASKALDVFALPAQRTNP